MNNKTLLLTLLFAAICTLNLSAQIAVGEQVTQEADLVSGEAYILQSMASGQPYVEDKGTYYSLPNAGNQPTEACVYILSKNDDNTWQVKGWSTGKCWGVPTYNEAIVPSSVNQAGHWSLNFNNGIAYPTALDAGGTVRGLDRSSGKLWAYDVSTKITKQIKFFRLGESLLSSSPLKELEGKVVKIADKAADNLTTDKWYVMFDRGTNPGNHGYLYEKAESHTLFNTATVPAGRTLQSARFLVRLKAADGEGYYIQNGFGNYFGALEHKIVVPVIATPQEAIRITKIAETNGHFCLQSISTNVFLNANDLSKGDATVVGWGTSAPTSTGGNDDWAFYPVTLEDVGEEVALFEEDVTVKRGYQTTGRGNRDALLLRIDLTVSQDLNRTQLVFSLDEQTRKNLSSLYLYETSAPEFLANIPETPIATTDDLGETVTLDLLEVPLTAGTHRLWLCATIKEEARLGDIVSANLIRMDYTTSADVSLDLTSVGAPDRQGMKIFDQQHFIFVPTTDDCRYYRIPAMILDKDGNIVIAIDKRYNSNSDLGNHKIDVISMRSEDGGRTWTDKATIAEGDGRTAAYYGYGDAALARAANGDLVCIMASGSKTWGYGMVTAGYAKSTDNGRSWTLTQNLLDSESSAFYDENSEDGRLSVANIFTTSGKGLTTTDGIIMFTTNCKGSTALCYILYSTDNGNHWRLSNAVAYSGCDESKLEQLNDGSLLLSVRQSGNRGWNTATYTKNDDGTVTFNWGTQYRNGNIWGNACNADILYYSRSTDNDADILIHSYINSSGRESLQLSMSLDGGESWKSAYNIQPNGSCYSTMQVLPDGTLAILFEDESYSAGNGYAINFVTLPRQQIHELFTSLGGDIPVGIPSVEGSMFNVPYSKIYNLAGQRLSKPLKGVNIVNGKCLIIQ